MPSNQNYVLQQILEFDDNDLRANKLGELTDHQRRQLRNRLYLLLVAPIIVITVLLITVPTAWQSWQQATKSPFYSYLHPNTSDYLLIFVFTLTFALLLFVIWYEGIRPWSRYSRDLKQRRVESVEGVALLKPKGGGQYRRYFIQISTLDFLVRERVMLAFQSGGRYRVYYTPDSKTIVAAEILDAEAR